MWDWECLTFNWLFLHCGTGAFTKVQDLGSSSITACYACSYLFVHLQPYWQVEVCPLCETNICADAEILLSFSKPGNVLSPKLSSPT